MVFTVSALPISEPELTKHKRIHNIIHISQYLCLLGDIEKKRIPNFLI